MLLWDRRYNLVIFFFRITLCNYCRPFVFVKLNQNPCNAKCEWLVCLGWYYRATWGSVHRTPRVDNTPGGLCSCPDHGQRTARPFERPWLGPPARGCPLAQGTGPVRGTNAGPHDFHPRWEPDGLMALSLSFHLSPVSHQALLSLAGLIRVSQTRKEGTRAAEVVGALNPPQSTEVKSQDHSHMQTGDLHYASWKEK